MINKSDYCIKGLTVSFITKPATCASWLTTVWSLKINFLVLFVIPRWEISSWISSGGYHCCDQCAGFSPFSGQGSGYIHVGLSLCDVIAACFFPFHLFLSYPWFTTTGPLALLLSNRVQVFTLAAPSLPPSFPSFFVFGFFSYMPA